MNSLLKHEDVGDIDLAELQEGKGPGQMPCKSINVVPVAATSSRSSVSAAFFRR
jgi:hypothetical protein